MAVKNKQYKVTFPQEDDVKLEVLCSRTGKIPQYYIRQAVKEFLEKYYSEN